MIAELDRAGRDRFDQQLAGCATGLLRELNNIGLLSAADVHVASRMAALVGEHREPVRLAIALAVRAPRLGHVFVDLDTIRLTASAEHEAPADLSTVIWPEVADWVHELTACDLVAVGDDDSRPGTPLRLLGSRLYLDRYWREERRIATDLQRLIDGDPPQIRLDVLADGLARLFADDGGDARQSLAAAAGVLRRFAVVAGGPGTGKTTTVARIVALQAEQAAAGGSRPPLVALAAPTGKAAARLQEAVHEEARRLPVGDDIRDLLLGLAAVTLHRLLGRRPGSHSRFGHDRENRLAHDVVIVDETSMVSLSLMARLVEAIRPEARLILVGDPGQLASIEAGVVLSDIVGPAAERLRINPAVRSQLSAVTGCEVAAAAPPGDATVGDGIIVLSRVHRYGGGIARLADAIRRGDPDRALEALGSAPDEITWIALDVEAALAGELEPVRVPIVRCGAGVIDAARAGKAREALAALAQFRLLCAHRHGPDGVSSWTVRVQQWLAERFGDLDLEQRDYIGRPLLVTENDYELGLYNGDTGVIVSGCGGDSWAVFERGGEVSRLLPLRLGAVETVFAMTIHKSQGSQFETAAVLLPATSPILTRELLYTAVTRARRRLILVATEEAVRTAVGRPIARASGLRGRLWGDE